MAGFPKIWTFIRHEYWFKNLKANERGAVLEMLLMTKEQQDNGHVVVNSMSVLAYELSINRKTLGKLVVKLTQGSTPVLVIFNQKPLDLYFPKYLQWQQMTVSAAVKNVQASGAKMTSYQLEQLEQLEQPVQTKEKPVRKKPEPDERIERIFELFKANCPSMISPQLELTEPRKRKIRTRLKEHPDLDWWRDLFQEMEASDWLTGRAPETNGWSAAIDWILEPKNLQKVIEGNYKNKGIRDTKNDLPQCF